MPKNSQFWACFGVFEQLNLVRLNFAVAVKLYFVHLLLIKMVGMLKSREIAWNQVFCVKNVDFSPNYKAFGGKCACIKKLDMKWIEIALEYCTFTLISSLDRKRSNIQCKLWNCPPTPYSQARWGGGASKNLALRWWSLYSYGYKYNSLTRLPRASLQEFSIFAFC